MQNHATIEPGDRYMILSATRGTELSLRQHHVPRTDQAIGNQSRRHLPPESQHNVVYNRPAVNA